jgi:hypothetical protein
MTLQAASVPGLRQIKTVLGAGIDTGFVDACREDSGCVAEI